MMKKCKIIAEIGWNHLGDIELAKEMISAAAESGADYAKFQTWSTKHLIPGPWDTDGRLELYKKSEITPDQHFILLETCKKNKIHFLTSIFNVEHIDLIKEMEIKDIKIASMEIKNKELLNQCLNSFDNIFLSTGASNYDEIIEANKILKNKCVLFHCVSIYPTPPANINLPRINDLKKINNRIGYSGHFNHIDDAVFALNYGVLYIEKHFTIDRNLPGRDNKFSITPEMLEDLCRIRDNYTLMSQYKGNDFQEEELDVRNNYRGRWSK